MLTLVGKRRVLWDPAEQINEEGPVIQQAPLTLEQFQASLPGPEVIGIGSEPVPAIAAKVQGKAVVIEPKTTRAYKQREGNGHKIGKVRGLINPERDRMREFFINHNGQIGDDDCVNNKTFFVASDVTIFQVTGFISVLHNDVAEGQIQLKDLPSYEQWMRAKYGGLWARYNNPMYVTVRKQNQADVAVGKKPSHYLSKEKKVKVWVTPKFSPLPRKRW